MFNGYFDENVISHELEGYNCNWEAFGRGLCCRVPDRIICLCPAGRNDQYSSNKYKQEAEVRAPLLLRRFHAIDPMGANRACQLPGKRLTRSYRIGFRETILKSPYRR